MWEAPELALEENLELFLLEIFVIFRRMRILVRKLTITDISDLGADDVFASTATTPFRILNRLYSHVSTIFEHKVSDGHFTNVTTQTIKHQMVLIYCP